MDTIENLEIMRKTWSIGEETMIDNLEETLEIQSVSGKEGDMNAFIINEINSEYDNVTIVTEQQAGGTNIYVTKGKADIYPCVVAHTDTVHDFVTGYGVRRLGDNFYAMDSTKMEQVGVGGDDKVGIWAALECIKKFDNIKAAFFHSEERGCVGSKAATPEFFQNVGYILQTDRRGNEDFVTKIGGINLMSKKFKKAVKPLLDKHGFKFQENGGLTDVKALKPISNVSVTNISSGYYRPHSDQEYVNIIDAMNTLSLMMSIIEKLGETKYEHQYEEPVYSYNDYGGYGVYGQRSLFPKSSKDTIEDFGTKELERNFDDITDYMLNVDWHTNLLKDSWGYMYPVYDDEFPHDIIGAYNAELDCIDDIEDVIADYLMTKEEPYWSSVAKNLLTSPTF